jgi:hypothetical protein
MWYKTAKQGSVWSRISPDAENIFDALLDNATKINNEKKYIDIKTLYQSYKQSIFKDMILAFIEKKMRYTIGGSFISNKNNNEIKAILNKFFPTFFSNQITVNKTNFYKKPYQEQRMILKHELAHAIVNFTIPFAESGQEPYLPSKTLKAYDIGEDIGQTNLLILKHNITDNPKLNKYLSQIFGNDFNRYITDARISLEQRTKITIDTWQKLNEAIKNQTINLPKDILNLINKINNDNFQERTKKTIRIDRNKITDQKLHDTLRSRANTLENPWDDLYVANPDETRSIIVEMQHIFSLSLIKEYYQHLLDENIYEDIQSSKIQYLEDIKKMFNLVLKASYETQSFDKEFIYKYYSPQVFSEYFGIQDGFQRYISKRYDYKFKEQIAKHLNNVYQELKEDFNKIDTPENNNLSKEPNNLPQNKI